MLLTARCTTRRDPELRLREIAQFDLAFIAGSTLGTACFHVGDIKSEFCYEIKTRPLLEGEGFYGGSSTSEVYGILIAVFRSTLWLLL